MKQSRLVSMIGALVVMISAVVCITACPNANNLKNNSGDSLEIKPTGEADPALAGTRWRDDGNGKTAAIFFEQKGNLASILGVGEAVYTVKDTKISFDLSSFIAIYKNMTVDKYTQLGKAELKASIAELEEKIKQETDAEKKKELEQQLEEVKKKLKNFENPDKEFEDELKEGVKFLNKLAAAMEAHTKIEGEFNADKTQLTIEKYPDYDGETVTVKKVVLNKQ